MVNLRRRNPEAGMSQMGHSRPGALVGTASASFSRACSIRSRAPGTDATMRSIVAATFCSLNDFFALKCGPETYRACEELHSL